MNLSVFVSSQWYYVYYAGHSFWGVEKNNNFSLRCLQVMLTYQCMNRHLRNNQYYILDCIGGNANHGY